MIFEDRELSRIPKLHLLKRDEELPDAVGHIEQNDRVCYVREEHLLLDPLNPRGSVALCLIKMEEALQAVVSGDLGDEIAREWPQHWGGLPTLIDLPANFSGVAHFYRVQGKGDGPLFVVAETTNALRRLGVPDAAAVARKSDTVCVLSFDKDLTFAAGERAPDNFKALSDWLQRISPPLLDKLIAMLSSRWPARMFFLLHAPNGTVGGALELPILLSQAIQRPQAARRVLTTHAHKISVARMHGVRVDADFIFRRNMNDQANLSGKRIALVGIGTIGGFAAKFLAQSGAGTGGGQLLLIDNQGLAPGNVGRHFLGLPYIGINKAESMRRELLRTLPDCDVGVYAGDVLKRKADLLGYDLIVDATGERALSEVLNQEFVQARRQAQTSAAILHAWLVGNGVAAQALMIDDKQHACFRCLRLKDSDQERFRLLRPDHPASMTPANCGEGAYFAYGVGAPAIASGLAVQMVLDWVNARPSPRFRTIRIVEAATFAVKDANVTRLEGCPVCASL